MSFSSSTEAVTVTGLSIKKFESQSEVDEKKKKRQEEWEKVRKPDDPTECPEAPVDNRCLYDKLEEQRLKKQEEFEEQTAFKNQIKRLDDDEVEFLDFVSERQQEISRAKNKEEAEIMSELKTAQVVKLGESKDEGKKSKPSQQTATKRSQSALLSGAVKKKDPKNLLLQVKRQDFQVQTLLTLNQQSMRKTVKVTWRKQYQNPEPSKLTV